MGIYDSIALSKEAEEREQSRFYHSKYKTGLLTNVYNNPHMFLGEVYKEDPDKKGALLLDEKGKPYIPVDYNKGESVICCPEPLEFIKAFNPIMNNQDDCKKLMKGLIAGTEKYGNATFKRIKLDHQPKDAKWFNSTKNGINLRPGTLNGDMNRMDAVRMADIAVHGLIAGRTGSGKSVFLNDLIINLLIEYAPWELDIYLADFKKVELSRYMTKYAAPHIKTCAATSEIRYVITMLQYIVECMQARQDLFTRLGIQKLSEFRERYGVVLPRVILIIDEFQQMFQEAQKKEPALIQDALMSITKLGRATGFHLMFASQEMSGTLGGKAMANFKIRFALQCDSDISGTILGNNAATTLERGYVLANIGSGKVEENLLYRVPYIPDDDDEESYFYSLLHEIKDDAESFGFEKNKTFYQEDFQLPIQKLSNILKKVEEYKRSELESNPTRFLDIFTLGRGVVYTDKKYDLESFYLERGRNKNIIAVCSDVDDQAYLKKLLAVNFANSPYKERYTHVSFELNPILDAKYHINSDLDRNVIINKSVDMLKYVYSSYSMRQSQIVASKMDSVEGFINTFVNELIAQDDSQKEALERMRNRLLKLFNDCPLTEIKNYCEDIVGQDRRYWQQIEPVYNFYLNRVKNKPWALIFTPLVYWISGFEYIEKLDKKMPFIMKNGMDVNILFIILTDSIKGMDFNKDACVKTCEYIFVNSKDERIYDKFGMSFTKKSRNSITIDFKIKSLNTERAFKKYSVDEMKYDVPEINFDRLLLDME